MSRLRIGSWTSATKNRASQVLLPSCRLQLTAPCTLIGLPLAALTWKPTGSSRYAPGVPLLLFSCRSVLAGIRLTADPVSASAMGRVPATVAPPRSASTSTSFLSSLATPVPALLWMGEALLTMNTDPAVSLLVSLSTLGRASFFFLKQ